MTPGKGFGKESGVILGMLVGAETILLINDLRFLAGKVGFKMKGLQA